MPETGEAFVLKRDNIDFECSLPRGGKLWGRGSFFLSSKRIVFVALDKSCRQDFRSFAIPLQTLRPGAGEVRQRRGRGPWKRQAVAAVVPLLLYHCPLILLKGGLLKGVPLMVELRGADQDFLAYQFLGLGRHLSFGTWTMGTAAGDDTNDATWNMAAAGSECRRAAGTTDFTFYLFFLVSVFGKGRGRRWNKSWRSTSASGTARRQRPRSSWRARSWRWWLAAGAGGGPGGLGGGSGGRSSAVVDELSLLAVLGWDVGDPVYVAAPGQGVRSAQELDWQCQDRAVPRRP
eukprot:s6831_g5.t1